MLLLHFRVIPRVVQATAFLASQRATHYQIGSEDQIAQFDQVVADAEVGVELVNLAHQQSDTVFGALQAFGGANDPDIIPHEAPKFVPVVRNDDFFVGIDDAAFIPFGQGRQGFRLLTQDVIDCCFGEYDAFEQRIGSQPIGAMQSGARGFAGDI